MDDDTWILIDRIGMRLGVGLVLLAIVGELLGWWDDVGVAIGALGFLATLVTGYDVRGRRLDRRFDLQERLQGQMLDKQDETNEGIHQIVRILDERLPRPD